MREKYEVIIVGAGPAGLFATYELIKSGFTKILLLDKGKKVTRRERKDVLWGVGGAGLFSDGKLNFTPRLGKTDLTELLGLPEAEKLVDELEEIFQNLGVNGKAYPTDLKKASAYRTMAKKLGLNLQIVRQRHLGSDSLPRYVAKMEKYLLDKGVVLLTEVEALKILAKNGKIVGISTSKGEFKTEKLLIAPGRSGNNWLTSELGAMGVELEQKAIEVGIRIEVPSEVLADICKIIYDPAIYLRTEAYDDQLRTFCTNPAGFVAEEHYKEFVCVNGHAYSNKHSENANFALLDKVSLTEPVTDTIAYGESICKLASTIGGGKPILQRLADFKRHRRSTWERLAKGYVKPTLKDVTPGDIGMALPYRIVVNLLEGLEKLDKMMPGLASDSTLLYAPEVKFFSVRPRVDNHLETKIAGLYVAGDGAGVSGNIVGAAATGMIAARGIIARRKSL